jgi:transcriptional regulator with XRE-family HTH domain
MKSKITQQEIGKRLVSLRKNKGLSQGDLAKKVGISRSSLTQVELGNRSLSALEIHNFSIQLGFSIDDFMSEEFVLNPIIQSKVQEEKFNTRISVPKLKVNKFKNILLYILENCAGKPNVGETLLYKLLYFSDFNYYELHEEHLSGATYRKLPYGPVPKNLDAIIKTMIDEGSLKRIKTDYHNYPQTRYLPLRKADLTGLKASEKEVIDKVIDQFSDWSAKAISDYSHKDIPWIASKDGKEINYELVFYREAPFSVRNYQEED